MKKNYRSVSRLILIVAFAVILCSFETGIKVQCNRPLSRIKYWSRNTTYCPEPYIAVIAGPGQEFSWEYTYSFDTFE